MQGNKSSISKADSYEKIREFWDAHAVTDFWNQTEEVEFEVEMNSQETDSLLETLS